MGNLPFRLGLFALLLLCACSSNSGASAVQESDASQVTSGQDNPEGPAATEADSGKTNNNSAGLADAGDATTQNNPPAPPSREDAGGGVDGGAPGGPVACRADKLQFDQAGGCAHDGSIEFCTTDASQANLDELEGLLPGITCQVGPGGRAGCVALGEALCMIPIEGCSSWSEPLSDQHWANLCGISLRDDVRTMARTIYE